MQFQYLLQCREAADALAVRFPGDPPARHAGRRPLRRGVFGWALFLVLTIVLFLLLSNSAAVRRPGSLRAALGEPDRLDHPVFVIGILLCTIGGAMMIVPAAYLFARRRSTRPIFDVPVTFEIGDAGITLRTAARETLVRWEGVIAVAETRRLIVLKTTGELRPTLPLRCVPSPQALQAVRDELRRRVPPLAGVVDAPGVAA